MGQLGNSQVINFSKQCCSSGRTNSLAPKIP